MRIESCSSTDIRVWYALVSTELGVSKEAGLYMY